MYDLFFRMAWKKLTGSSYGVSKGLKDIIYFCGRWGIMVLRLMSVCLRRVLEIMRHMMYAVVRWRIFTFVVRLLRKYEKIFFLDNIIDNSFLLVMWSTKLIIICFNRLMCAKRWYKCHLVFRTLSYLACHWKIRVYMTLSFVHCSLKKCE